MAYIVWFRSNRSGSQVTVQATSRKEAIALFAAHNNCIPSEYISARLA